MTNQYIENRMLDGTLVSRLKADVEDLFSVANIEVPRQLPQNSRGPIPGLGRRSSGPAAENSQGSVIFVGELLRSDSEAVYDLIAERWRAHNYTPLLHRYRGRIALVAQPGVIIPKPSNPRINLILAVVTILSVAYTGMVYECECLAPTTLAGWLSGIPMMLAVMIILAAHEFGHYFAARYHKVAVTLPYFIPLPLTLVGTLGAVIQLRSPFKTKKQLFDIGVAGPLGGLIFVIPLVFWAVANAPVQPLGREVEAVFLEGNSIFYLLVKYMAHGQLLPHFEAYADLPFWQEFLRLLTGVLPSSGGNLDIHLDSVALAAWFGLVVTALNLLPIGQLDGGHVIYCLLGDKARVLGLGVIIIMVFAGIFLWSGWLIWALITFFLIGPGHPPPLNDLVELGPARTILAYVMIAIFILLFTPNPLQILESQPELSTAFLNHIP